MKLFCLILIAVLAMPMLSSGQESRLRPITGAITFESIHDDNVNMLENGDSDRIFKANAGFTYEHTLLKTFLLSLEADLGFRKYDNNAYLDDEYYRILPSIVFLPGQGEFGSITFGGDFREEVEPIDSTNTTLVESRRATAWVKLDWRPVDVWGVEAGTTWESKDYEQEFEGLEYDLLTYYGGLFITPGDRTKLGVRYTVADKDFNSDISPDPYGTVNPYQRRDSVTQRTSAFVDYALTGKVSVGLETGVQSVDYDESNGTTTDADTESGDKAFASANIVYAATDSLEIDAGYSYDVLDSSSLQSNYYTQETYKLGLSYSPVDKWSIGVDGLYWITNENVGVDSNGVEASCSLRYALAANLDLIAKYRYVKRNAIAPVNDYEKNVGSLGVSYTF